MFNFLYYEYFSRIAFSSVYLSGYKMYIFTDLLEIIRFTGSVEEL